MAAVIMTLIRIISLMRNLVQEWRSSNCGPGNAKMISVMLENVNRPVKKNRISRIFSILLSL